MDPEAERHLLEADWPGNIRELANALERASILSDGGPIGPALLGSGAPVSGSSRSEPRTLEAIEREAIARALERHGGHREKAAGELGIGVRTLYDKLRRYDLR